MKKELFNPAPAAPLLPPPTHIPQDNSPRPLPNHAMLVEVLRFAGLPNKDTISKLEKLHDKWKAELAAMKGFGYDDALREYRANIRDALDGKLDAKTLPTKSDLIQRNSDVRKIAKGRAAVISKEACLIAADVYEAALKRLPEYTAKLLESERAIFSGSSNLGKSPLQYLCDQMPDFFATHIAKLRDRDYAMSDPKTVILF